MKDNEAINRWTAVEIIRKLPNKIPVYADGRDVIDRAAAQAEIMLLPCVSTEKTGQWYLCEMFANGETILECSVCHNKHDKPWNYCPNCGARMKEV